MDRILAIPIELRAGGSFVLGALVGSLVNLWVYQLAWEPRATSHWSRTDASWTQRIPIVGWLAAGRQGSDIPGSGAWLRPMLVELLTGAIFAGLYFWEVQWLGLMPAARLAPAAAWYAHAAVLSHWVLISLMLAASLIDIDERIIPDSITVPGTLAGLFLAALVPWSLLPAALVPVAADPPTIEVLKLTTPNPWPERLAGFPHIGSLVLGLGCFGLWCVALLPRRWHSRRGWRTAVVLLVARMTRDRWSPLVMTMGVAGSVAIFLVWCVGGADHWAALLSALVGLAGGAGLVWSVRVIGTSVLGREAMGFGDVTLMGMIGAFLGWQSTLIIFFLSPFCALAIAVIQWLRHRETEIYYGPFLCLAAGVLIIRWESIWNWARPIFALAWLVPIVMIVCLTLLAGLLYVWRVLALWFGEQPDGP